MKSVTNRYRPNFRQGRASQPVPTKPAVTPRDTVMSKPTKTKAPKAAAVSDAKVTQTSKTTLSDAVLAAALQAIKEPTTPAKSAKTKNATTPGAQTKAKTASAKRSAPRKTSTAHHPPSQDLINQMVEEAAYYLAEKRNFAPGFEEQDWLSAKAQIKRQLEETDNHLK
jgi:hypothetical protein